MEQAIVFIIIFIFGTIIGSFLNVVILRLGTGKLALRSLGEAGGGRSVCFNCNKKLEWFELIPILSFFIQKGHCRKCHSRISNQYPIVEILTGLIFLLIFNFQFSIFNFQFSSELIFNVIFYWLIFSILIIISVYDIRHKIIPNKIVWIFIILSLFSIFVTLENWNLIENWSLIIGNLGNYIIAGVVVALPLFLIWFLSKGRLMGLGDAKLALGMGFLLGFSGGLAALILAFWIGAIFGIILLVLKRKTTFKTEIPFGPFLCLSTFLVFIFNLDLGTLVSSFNILIL